MKAQIILDGRRLMEQTFQVCPRKGEYIDTLAINIRHVLLDDNHFIEIIVRERS